MKCLICSKKITSISCHVKEHKITIKEYYDKYLKKVNEGICICGNNTKFIGVKHGYREYCSYKCRGKQLRKKTTLVNKQCPICKKQFIVNGKSNKIFCSTTCVNKDKEHINKVKISSAKTKLEKYGNENFNNSDKRKITNFKKYGYENAGQFARNKIKETNLKKYGNENYFKTKDFKIKTIQTNLRKYGDNTYFGSKKYENVRKNTFINYLFNGQRLNGLVKPLFNIKEFNSVETNYRFECIKCGNIFESNLSDGKIPRCLNCFPYETKSLYEEEIGSFIRGLGFNIINNNRKLIGGYEIDIYIPEKNVGIEFNGLYWHSETSGKKDKYYHYNKYNFSKKNNIRLIQIFEDEWLNKREIVENRLKHILNKNNIEKIFARKCVIRQIDNKEKDIFLVQNHIQGKDISKIRYGAFYNNELVAVMTFTQGRFSSRIKKVENEYELSRFATSKNVVGIASRLFKHFINDYNPNKISTYADLRWSNGSLYEKLGMKLVGTTKPNYFYYKYGQNYRFHRFNFRKSELIKKLQIFDNNLTEWQNMQLNGYDRIWDCGNLKYEFNNG